MEEVKIQADGLYSVMAQEMRLRNYSPKTIKSYKSCIRSFVKYIQPMHPREANDKDIRKYLLHVGEYYFILIHKL